MSKSIDDVLDRRQDDELINLCGKLAIAECILKAEKQSPLFIQPFHGNADQSLDHTALKDTWFYSFINMLIEGVSRSRLDTIFNNVSFISFNYDRCLKHFLTHALSLNYGLSLNDAKGITKTLKVIYPYGSIAPSAFEANDGLAVGADVNGARLLEIAARLRTFTEQNRAEQVTSKIEEEIKNASKIVFLGFAYHQQNLEILNVNNYDLRSVFGTAFEISDPDIDVIQNELRLAFRHPDSGNFDITVLNMSCVGLFNEYSRGLPS